MPSDPFLGQIMPAAFGIVPRGWAACNGALLSIQQNQALFSLLGTTYGGNGINNFALPDLRGRAGRGSDFGSVPLGEVIGSETVAVSTSELPTHNHALQASTQSGPGGKPPSPAGKVFGQNTLGAPVQTIFAAAASAEVALSAGTNVTNTGGGQAHNNMQPSLVVNYVIALQGAFPSRD